MTPTNIVAAFDFDGTVSNRESLQLFLRYAIGEIRFAYGALKSAPALLRADRSPVYRHAAKECLLRNTIGGKIAVDLNKIAQQFAEQKIPKIIRPEMAERIKFHKDAGHMTVLVSASPGIYLRRWGLNNGFDAVLCSELDIEYGLYTGKLRGLNCWGMEKVRKLYQWWGESKPDFLYVYGDSKGDHSMLSLAQERWYKGEQLSRDKVL